MYVTLEKSSEESSKPFASVATTITNDSHEQSAAVANAPPPLSPKPRDSIEELLDSFRIDLDAGKRLDLAKNLRMDDVSSHAKRAFEQSLKKLKRD
eukprot:363736-Amorphochlora_amoeboformis.AAC.1